MSHLLHPETATSDSIKVNTPKSLRMENAILQSPGTPAPRQSGRFAADVTDLNIATTDTIFHPATVDKLPAAARTSERAIDMTDVTRAATRRKSPVR
jgi:hypothetical protein